MDAPADRQLVAQVLAGDRQAFSLLVRRHQDFAYGLAVGVVCDFELARDVVQEAFLAAFRSLGRLADADRFAAWLGGIVRNTARRALRELARVRKLAEELCDVNEPPDPAPTPPAAAIENERRRIVREALAGLAPVQREAASLYYVNGFSYADIAGMLGVSEAAVQGRLQRARAALRKELMTMVEQTFHSERLPEDFAEEIRRLLDAAQRRGRPRDEAVQRLVQIGGPAVDPLCEALGDARVAVRQAAARALCRIGDARALRPILRVLCAEDYWLANDLLRSGAVLQIPGMLPELIRLAREGTAGQRYWAVEALSNARGEAEVIALLEHIRSDAAEPPKVRNHAVAALCRLQPERACQLLVEAIDDAGIRRISGWAWWIALRDGHRLPIELCCKGFDRRVAANGRMMAGWLILRHGEEGRAVLAECMRSGSPDERAAAALALGSQHDPAAFDVLLDELLHGYQERKWSRKVAGALLRWYGQRLHQWADRERPDVADRPALGWALAQVRLAAGGAAAADVLQFGAPAARAAAIRRMLTEQGAAFLPELRRILREGRPGAATREAFRRMQQLRDASLPTVQQMRTSEHWTERKAAVCLLRRWGRLTAEQKAEALSDPHIAVQHAADWPPAARAAAQWHPKWQKRLAEGRPEPSPGDPS